MPQPTKLLPDSYWWTDDGRTLYHNYRWMATVGEGRVKIRGPRGDVEGPCGSDAHGRMMVERWLAGRAIGCTKTAQAKNDKTGRSRLSH